MHCTRRFMSVLCPDLDVFSLRIWNQHLVLLTTSSGRTAPKGHLKNLHTLCLSRNWVAFYWSLLDDCHRKGEREHKQKRERKRERAESREEAKKKKKKKKKRVMGERENKKKELKKSESDWKIDRVRHREAISAPRTAATCFFLSLGGSMPKRQRQSCSRSLLSVLVK